MKVSSSAWVAVAIQVNDPELIKNFILGSPEIEEIASLNGANIFSPTLIFFADVYLLASFPNIKLIFFKPVNLSKPLIGFV